MNLVVIAAVMMNVVFQAKAMAVEYQSSQIMVRYLRRVATTIR